MPPIETQRTSGDLSGDLSEAHDLEHLDYWERFYGDASAPSVPLEPSPFARWVAGQETGPGPLVDVGSGNGRDTLWFARQGFVAHGLDVAHTAVSLATKQASDAGLAATFGTLNLYDLGDVRQTGQRVAAEVAPTVVYARFLVHAIEDHGRVNLWTFVRTALGRRGGRAFLEFRTSPTTHVFGEHFRHFVSPDRVVGEIEAQAGRVESLEQGHGLAVYKTEDPLVCRISARWQAASR